MAYSLLTNIDVTLLRIGEELRRTFDKGYGRRTTLPQIYIQHSSATNGIKNVLMCSSFGQIRKEQASLIVPRERRLVALRLVSLLEVIVLDNVIGLRGETGRSLVIDVWARKETRRCGVWSIGWVGGWLRSDRVGDGDWNAGRPLEEISPARTLKSLLSHFLTVIFGVVRYESLQCLGWQTAAIQRSS